MSNPPQSAVGQAASPFDRSTLPRFGDTIGLTGRATSAPTLGPQTVGAGPNGRVSARLVPLGHSIVCNTSYQLPPLARGRHSSFGPGFGARSPDRFPRTNSPTRNVDYRSHMVREGFLSKERVPPRTRMSGPAFGVPMGRAGAALLDRSASASRLASATSVRSPSMMSRRTLHSSASTASLHSAASSWKNDMQRSPVGTPARLQAHGVVAPMSRQEKAHDMRDVGDTLA